MKGDQVGKINICDNWTYVAVASDSVDFTPKVLGNETWKERSIKAWLLKDAVSPWAAALSKGL